MTNILQGDFNLYSSTLSLGAGRSTTRARTPYSHEMQFRIDAPFTVDLSALSYLAPYLIMNEQFIDESDISKYYMYDVTFQKELAKETEYSAWLD